MFDIARRRTRSTSSILAIGRPGKARCENPFDSFIYLASSADFPEDLLECLHQGTSHFLTFCQALAASGYFAAARGLLVTRGAQHLPGDGDLILASSPLLGLAQALPFELKGLRIASVDFGGAAPEAFQLEAIHQELTLDHSAAEIAYRGTRRYVRTLAPIRTSNQPSFEARRQGVYLITGGLGGIGRQIATRLARQADVRLILCGRSRLDEPSVAATRKEQTLRALGAAGASVEYLSGDVSRPEFVEELFRHIEQRYGRLDGVFHAAGVLDAQQLALRTKTLESFQSVLAAKIDGSWRLWQASQPYQPRCFVMLSSVSAIAGALAAGQSDYAVANRFQIDLAEALQAQGHKQVQTIVLSEWAGTGMLEQHQTGPIVRRLGLQPLAGQATLEALFSAMALSGPHAVVLNVDRSRFSIEKLLAPLPSASSALPTVEPVPAAPCSSAPPARQRLAQLIELLIGQFAEMLQISPDQIDPRTNLMELGFDSILAVQLAQQLRHRLGLELTPTTLFRFPSAKELAESLAENDTGRLSQAIAKSTQNPHEGPPDLSPQGANFKSAEDTLYSSESP